MSAHGKPVDLQLVDDWPNLTRGQVIQSLQDGYCLFCGAGPFLIVGTHMAHAHGVPAALLREHYGLNRGQPTCSPERQAQLRERQLERIAAMTEEERAASTARLPKGGTKGITMRPQAREQMSAARDQGRRVERTCEVCGLGFRDYKGNRARYCSNACRLSVAGPHLHDAFVKRESSDPEFKALMDERRRANLRLAHTPEAAARRDAGTRAAWEARLGQAEHGTLRMYRRGCHCELCRDANASAHHDYLQRKVRRS